MEEGSRDPWTSFVVGLLLGAAIGATTALLAAPQSGRRTRKKLGKAATGIRKGTEERWGEFAEDVKGRVDEAIAGARRRLGKG